VFNTGLLAAPRPGTGSRYEYDDVPPAVLDRVRRIEEVCALYDVALPVAALQFPLQEQAVRNVVVGGATAGHVRENAARMGTEVPDALWQRLRAEGLVPG
jgi:D-threo-aldose 1-dehydrogenase